MRRWSAGCLFLLMLLCPRLVTAQTHYCDTTPPTAGAAIPGQVLAISTCIGPNDTNGVPFTVTGWALYDNGVRTLVTLVKGTTSTVSNRTVWAGTYTVPAVTGVRTLQTAAIASALPTPEGAKSIPFVLTVSLPPGAPPAPTHLSLQ